MKILVKVYPGLNKSACNITVSTNDLKFVGTRFTDGKYLQSTFYGQIEPSLFANSFILFQTIDEDAQEV